MRRGARERRMPEWMEYSCVALDGVEVTGGTRAEAGISEDAGEDSAATAAK